MDLLLSRIGNARAARVSSCGRAAGLRGMVLVGSGLLQAALEERSAPGLVVVCAGEVIAISTSSRALLNGAASKAELPNEVSAFASAVSNSGAQGTELRIGRKKIKLSGEPFTDAESGKTFAIISLEEVQSPWDQVADRESWHKILLRKWPFAFNAGERREDLDDTIFYSANEVGARILGAASGEITQAVSARQLGWSAAELAKWSTGLNRKPCDDYETFSLDCESEAAPTTGAKSVIHCYGVLFRDPEGGKNFRFVSTAEDVTEARRRERQLEHLQLLFHNAPLGMGTALLIDNDTDVLYESVNPLLASILLKAGGPRPPGGYRGSMLSNKAESAGFLAQAIECRNLGKPIDLEHATKSPHPAYWKVHYVPLGENRFGWIAQDITKQKELELMLRKEGEQLERAVHERTRDLEEALQVKSRFLAVVSHELRTPIAGILGSMELLCETAQLNAEQSTLLRIARTCGEQLSTVIEDILDFTKLHEKRVELQPQEFSLRELLENVVEISSLTLLGKSIELLLEPMTEGIMLNLLSNSVKFTQRGEIRVTVATDAPITEGALAGLRISVSDTGIGIPAQVRDKIFKPFSQADSSVSRRFGGSGLGLSISRHLAQLMGGDLTYESTGVAGHGTVFTLAIPTTVVRTCRPPPPLGLAASQRVRVFLVEEQASLRSVLGALIGQVLGGEGEVVSYDSVATATQAAVRSVGSKRSVGETSDDRESIWVLLTDQRRGPEAREAMSRQHVPTVCILYGYARDESAHASARHSLFLKKPVRVSALREALATALGGETAPVATVSTPPRIERAAKVPRRSRVRILVAEDNLSNQLILRKYLELLGYHDLTMPLKSGLEASEEIQRLVPAARRPYIVAVTASAFEEDRKRCLAAGMQEVLTKPVDRRKLERVLAQREAENR